MYIDTPIPTFKVRIVTRSSFRKISLEHRTCLTYQILFYVGVPFID